MNTELKIQLILTGVLLAIGGVASDQMVQRCYGNDNDTCFFADQGRSSSLKKWTDANSFCSNHSSTLPIISSLEKQYRLAQFLTENGLTIDSVWLAGKESTDGQWRWVDGTTYTGELSNSSVGSEPKNFRSVSISYSGESPVLAVEDFSSNLDGYICQFQGQSDCTGSDRFSSSGVCYVRYDESLNWFMARNKCLLGSGDLVVLQDTSPGGLNATLSKLQYFSNLDASGKQKKYWIGMRKILLKWQPGAAEVMVTYLRDVPTIDVAVADSNCLSVDYKQQWAWSIRDCSIAFKTVCQGIPGYSPSPTTMVAVPDVAPTVALPVWAVGVICGAAGLFYILSMVAVALIVWKCRRASEQSDSGKRGKNHYTQEVHMNQVGRNTLPPPDFFPPGPSDGNLDIKEEYIDVYEDEFDDDDDYTNTDIPGSSANIVPNTSSTSTDQGSYANGRQVDNQFNAHLHRVRFGKK